MRIQSFKLVSAIIVNVNKLNLLLMLLYIPFQLICTQSNSCNFLIPEGSKSWKIARFEVVEDEWGNPISFEQFNDEYVLTNDTIIDSNFSQRLYYIDESNDTFLLGFYHCLGESVVYSPIFNIDVSPLLQPSSVYNDGIVLNTLASVGDTIMKGFNDIGGVISIVAENLDTVTYLDGVLRRRIEIKDVQYFDDIIVSELPTPLYLVEGLGNSLNGLHLHFRRQFNDWTVTRELICYSENGNLVYINDSYANSGCNTESYAQVDSIYIPFLSVDSKLWYLMDFDFESDTLTSIVYNYGDTIINSIFFEKFYINHDDYFDNEEWYNSGVYIGAFHEQGQKIYFEHPTNMNNNSSIPIVDFSAGLGDTIFRYVDSDNFYWFGILTSKFDRSFDDGVQRTRYTYIVYSLDLDNSNGIVQEEYLESLIEGILIIQPNFSGSLFRLLFDRDRTEHVQCFYENNFQVFHSEYIFTEDLPCYYNGIISSLGQNQANHNENKFLYPNPSLDKISVLCEQSNILVDIEIISIVTGELMRKSTVMIDAKLDIRDFPSGNYIMKIIFPSGEIGKIKFTKM